MLDSLSILFSEQFLLRALLVGVLTSLCCALLGVSLVLKRFSMIGDGLSHVGFGALAIACAANVAPLYFSLPIVVAAAFLLLRINSNAKVKGDAAIALISTGALAVGVMVTSMTTGMNIDIYNYMFGSILTMTKGDVALSVILSVVTVIIFSVFFDQIFCVTFDEPFAKAAGVRVSAYNMLLAALTAVTIVVGMRIMGALLISSLIIFPAVISMKVCKKYRSVVILSAVVSVFCFVIGLIFSIKFEAPTGASVVCVNIAVLLLFSLAGFILSRPHGSFVYSIRKPLSAALFVLFTVVLIFVLSGPIDQKEEKRLNIVATSFVSYDFARQVCGDKAQVNMLLSPGEESHTFEPSPTDIMLISDCDVFIYGGGESDEWVRSILDSINQKNMEIIKLMDVTKVEKEDIIEGMQIEKDEDEYDEHVWTSPVKSIEIIKAICEAVKRKDADNSSYYLANANQYIDELKSLDNDFRALSTAAKNKFFVVADRFPFKYLADEYSLKFYAAFPGCSAQTDANPTTLAFLIRQVKSKNISVIFKVDLSSGTLARTISEATGAKILTLYSCHVISAEDFNSGKTYISLMRQNLNALFEAIAD